MIHYDPNELPHRDLHQILLSGVAPRPIAFVSSCDVNGVTNLAPFSFFNAYASKPPVVAIGPAIAAASGREKDTLLNILATGECTISVVNYSMVQQMNLASTDYPHGIDEYVKAGFTKAPSDMVKPPYVEESSFIMECKLVQNIELFREHGGNGNIMLLRVIRLHVREEVMTDGVVDPRKMDLVARMGYKWYARVTPENCFELAQPKVRGIGMDQLPDAIRSSEVLSGHDLAILAGRPSIPTADPAFNLDASLAELELRLDDADAEQIEDARSAARIKNNHERSMHVAAKLFIKHGLGELAWQCLVQTKGAE